MIISEDLFQDIINRKKKVDEKLERRSLVDRLLDVFKKSIDEEANVHSCRLEYNMNNVNKEKFNEEEIKEMQKHIKNSYFYLTNAWGWGLKNFKLDFDEDFIIEVAKKIEPDEVNGYRNGPNGVRPTGAPVTPPYPAKVPYEMSKLMKNLDYGRKGIKEEKINPVELAILTHYHLLRIHPFEDGNGRTARLIQNLILHNFSYPASVIFKGDKTEYIKHLREADKEFRFRDNNEDFWGNISGGEKNLYDYLASRINTSIDLILDEAYKK